MSERKSWDVQRRPARPQAAPEQVRAPVRQAPPARAQPARPQSRPTPRPQVQERRPSPRRQALPSGTLRERRTKRRRALRYLFIFLGLAIVIGAFYLAWRPTFRIQSVEANGPGADVAKQIVESNITGTYFHILPHNSTFFFPQRAIRAAILDAIPEAAAVSLKRVSFSALQVMTIPREESFVWCGDTISTPTPDGSCYEVDSQGFLFKPAAVNGAVASDASSTASTTPAARPKGSHAQVRVYGALDTPHTNGQSPLRAYVGGASYMANALKFVDAMRTLGAPVSALAIRGDEADVWLGTQTRITYVLGHEQDAATVAASSLPTLNLNDGSIQYVDLRFPGKAYVKKYGQ